MKCHACGKQMIKADDLVADMDGYSFIVNGLRCLECGEEIIDEKEGQKFIKVARRLGVWGEPLKLHRKLSQSGNGTVLRIPNDIAEEMKLKGNEEITIAKIGRKKIIIEVEEN